MSIEKKGAFQTHWPAVRHAVRRRFPRRIQPADLDHVETFPNRRAALCRLLAERCDELDDDAADREIDSILNEIVAVGI